MIDLLFRACVKVVLWFRYRVRLIGADKVAAKGRSGILFLPNHPALMDPIIIMIMLRKAFKPRALADSNQVDRFLIRRLASYVGVLKIPDLVRAGTGARELVAQAVDQCVEALKAGDNLVIYPAGHIYRGRYEDLRGNSAVETIIKALPDVRVVLVRTRGLWGSSFSWAGGKEPDVAACLRKGAWSLLLSGLLFAPKRKVSIELCEPDDLPRDADRETLNTYLEKFYNQDAPPNTYVPYTIWDRGGVRTMPEPELGLRGADAAEDVPEATRRQVTDYLQEATGASSLADGQHLARDLGFDSLARADLIVWLEKEFGFPQGDVEALQTVADVMLAACGETVTSHVEALKPILPKWFARKDSDNAAHPAEGSSIAEVFLNQALANPRAAVIADQTSGVKTYRDMLTGIFALKDQIAALQGDRVGIMLPASVGADILYMAAMFAGKTPVMVNWTVGWRNMIHSLDLVSVRSIVTAKALVSKLQAQGTDFGSLEERMVFLEDIGASLSLCDKLKAAGKARFFPAALRKAPVSETAVILFTSGSESLPKAVPLSHANILANIRDVCNAVKLTRADKLVGILPPFHSFGLTVGVVLPLCIGASVVHYPNPTDAAMLARITEAYKGTLLVGTPTFLAAVVRAAGGHDLTSLRFAVTGGEKCPDKVYQALGERCEKAKIFEGYGVTECSPIVSVNREELIKRGTIGQLLPSLTSVIVDPETNQRVPSGQQGMLLVRGPSVFSGYLEYDGPSPFIEFEGHQWYRTGDLVTQDSDGVITFRGRLKRFVKLGGEMISLPAVESVLEAHYESDENEGPVIAVEATPSEDHPELVLFATIDIDRETANRLIRESGLSALHNVRHVIHVDEIPLLGTGKTNYRALKEQLNQD